jgi:NADPH:quinone reductase
MAGNSRYRGCWQEVISAPAPRVLPLPADMSFEAGAAAPLNYLTALFALTRRARAQPGETLLVHGAVDIVADPVGGDRITDSLRSLGPEGRLLVLGFTAGQIPTVKVNRLLLGNTGVLGVASREFSEQRPETIADLWNQLLELWREGKLRDLPVQPYPFRDAHAALRAIADRGATGKVVLRL